MARYSGVSSCGFWITCVAFAMLCGCSSPQGSTRILHPKDGPAIVVSTHTLDLSGATMRFDLYRRQDQPSDPSPLVVVAHGLMRDRTHMAGWGERLAAEGFIVAIPDLPDSKDHPRNARCINELVAAVCQQHIGECQVDPQRIGMIGLSFGALSTLLAAADNPNVKVWVGLDPVDWRGRGVAAAPRVHARTYIVRAPPSIFNQNGGGIALRDALPGCIETVVPHAIHIDPEWPSDWLMEALIGRPSSDRREVFAGQATAALKSQLSGSTAMTKIE
jgi:acetyl esterase/lipase